MNNDSFQRDFDALIAKFSELMVGETTPEVIEKVEMWAIYNHIHKTMPALSGHWNQSHPESKAEIRKLFEEIRELNQQHQQKQKS
jgi:hypothetical protein